MADSIHSSPVLAARDVPPRPPSSVDQDMDFHAGETFSAGSGSDDSCTRKPMKNVSRERMKAETKFLRERVLELERELSTALAKRALDRCKTPSPVWRDLAKRQAARREKSEEERDRLRARLLHQLQVAKSLETVFRNRSGAFLDELCASASAHGHKVYPVDNLAQLHDEFMDEIDQLYPLVDTLFMEPIAPQEAMETPLRRSTVVSQQTNGDEKLYVELRNAVYVPFAYDRVCNAVWRAITTEYGRQQRLVEQFRCTADEYSCNFFSQNTAPGCGHHFMAAIVLRKFTEANRVVLVWRSVNWDALPAENREYGDETGWITVQPVIDEATGKPKTEGAMVRVCTRYVPILEVQAKLIEAGALEMEAAPGDASMKVGEVTNRILNGTEEDIAAITESIENILLDEAIGSAEHDLESVVDDLGMVHEPLHVAETSTGVLLSFPH